MANPYRDIPSVNELVEVPALETLAERVPRSLIVDAARRVLDAHRQSLRRKTSKKTDVPSLSELARRVTIEVEASRKPPLASTVNATGIIIHTGLGRAPLADEAVDALADVASHYAPVELEMDSGERGHRTDIVRPLLCELTGAESATVVNNNAAALMIILSTLAKDREVIVSRGELIEIGGSFRLPQVMETGGARLREVGTTNKTRVSDYEQAINEHTAALMMVHSSNYRIEGFTESPGVEALAALAHAHNLPLVHDTGSGAIRDLSKWGVRDEPNAHASIEAGADLVLFSGDKLLGGPQAGVIVGRAELIERIEKNSMMRALRVDKLILAALGVTLQLHRDEQEATRRVPVLSMLTASIDDLEPRANELMRRLRAVDGVAEVELVPTRAYLGGGALPAQAIPSVAVAVTVDGLSEHDLAQQLRTNEPRIVARVADERVLFDLRTIFPEQDHCVVEAVEGLLQRQRSG